MLKLLIFFLTFFSLPLFSQTAEVFWTDHFKKELHLNCFTDDSLCQMVCANQSFCGFGEGICKNCIGTGLKMNHILNELGKTIRNSEKIFSDSNLKELLHSGHFSTLSYRDVYNVIDGLDSLKVLKKFESLCPEGSLNQIVFLELIPITRDVKKALLVYCELDEKGFFFHLSQDPVVEVNEKKYP